MKRLRESGKTGFFIYAKDLKTHIHTGTISILIKMKESIILETR